MRLKIVIVVHGRFHAFDLARELIARGNEITLLTNYPKSFVERYGIPRANVRSCVAHGLTSRLARACRVKPGRDPFEPALHRWFSRWAARAVVGGDFDAIHCFSGVAEEALRAFGKARVLRSLVRGSAHICVQARLLKEERQRCGQTLDQPSGWMIQRELREYRLASFVIVLSSFAKRSFLAQGFPEERLRVLPLGSDLKRFRPAHSVIQERCHHILAGEPLRVLTVGSFTYQKGMLDLAEIARRLSPRIQFRFVGDIPQETQELWRACRDHIKFSPRQPQFLLPRQYEESDLFVFPTIQDGYAAVLAQAHASGLPILTTTNSAGPDLIREGATGWVLPVRNADGFVDRLVWCDEHREALATMLRRAALEFRSRDWSDVANDLEQIYRDALK
jgi:glycosyltransferase involved in cell wall biosynthesis